MKKRVLLVQDKLSYSGTSFLILFITKNLSDQYCFDLLCFENNNIELEKKFESYGGKIIRNKFIPHSKTFFIKIFIYFLRLINMYSIFAIKNISKDYYAIHSFEESMSSYYVKIAKKKKIPKRIVHFNIDHSTPVKLDFVRNHIIKKEFRYIEKYASDIIACSKKAIPINYKDNNRVLIINNPLDENLDFIKETPSTLTLIQIGKFCENKNQLFSLKILKHLLDNHPNSNASIIFVGYKSKNDEKYYQKMHDYIKNNKLENNIKFENANVKKMKVFKEASFLVMPSIMESFGITLVEAQATGLTCFASLAAPAETNLGGVNYLNIQQGPNIWAEIIYKEFISSNGKKQHFNTKKINNFEIINQYRKIYIK